jgi:hypothetical protein
MVVDKSARVLMANAEGMQLILERYYGHVNRSEKSIRNHLPRKRGGGPAQFAIPEAVEMLEKCKRDDEGFYSSLRFDEQGQVSHIMWASAAGKQMAIDFGDVLIMDCTYNVTRYEIRS